MIEIGVIGVLALGLVPGNKKADFGHEGGFLFN